MKEDDSWSVAVELLTEFCRRPARLDHLLERLPRTWNGGRRRACQSLLFGTVRHLRLLEKALDEFLQRRPKPKIRAALLVASWELMDQPDRSAKVVHHAVEKVGTFAGKSGRGLANAVLRKVAQRLPELLATEISGAEALAWRYSHPEWRVRKWIGAFGEEETKRFLEWNQTEPTVFARWQSDEEPVEGLAPVAGAGGYYRVESGAWARIEPYLREGRLYVQNPAARLAPELLLEACPEGRVLDLCAAPGGKSLFLEANAGTEIEEIVAVDLAGPRFERMKENLARYNTKRIRAVATDVLEIANAELGTFAAALIDVPCSNSGVLQHKIDARWRQTPQSVDALLELQLQLLAAAAGCVQAGGVLIYSTCSIDPEENEGTVQRFLDSEAGRSFQLERAARSLPWRDLQDGAGAFLLRNGG